MAQCSDCLNLSCAKRVLLALLLVMLTAFFLLDAISIKLDFSNIHKLLKGGSMVFLQNTTSFHQNYTISHQNYSVEEEHNVTADDNVNYATLTANNSSGHLMEGSALTYVNPVLATTVSWVASLSKEQQQEVFKEYEKLGIESTLLHNFKSPFIEDPKIFTPSVLKASLARPSVSKSNRTLKIISCFNCPPWFSGSPTNQRNKDFLRCPYSECRFDFKGKLASKAEALLFFPGFLGKRQPPKRPNGQIWIKAFWESPVHYSYPTPYDPWKSVFNWTYDYQLDADIFGPNNRLAWRNRDQMLRDEEYVQMAKNKTKTVAWFVSNCHTQSKRRKYVDKLKEYVDVDIYGNCGDKVCTRKVDSDCEKMLTTTYKFYLSFENSFCKDYVTEKFYRTFGHRSHVVPVTRGAFEYDKYFPQGGFVNAAHFGSPKELGLYLKNLSTNVKRYSKMLKEKDRLVGLNYKIDYCNLCERLHTRPETDIKMIPDIKELSHKDKCYDPKDI